MKGNGEGAGWAKEGIKLQCRLDKASASLECALEWALSIRIVHFGLKWPNLVSSPCSFTGCSLPQDGNDLGWGSSLQLKQSLKVLIARMWTAVFWSHFPQLANTHSPHWKRIWAVYLQANHTPWAMSWSHCAPSYILFIVGLTYFL